MKDVSSSHGLVLVVQFSMLFVDVVCNACAPALFQHNIVQLMIYIFQDVSTVMALIIILISFFSTYVFQAGLISLLVVQFKMTIFSSCIYLALSMTLHIWSLNDLWENQYADIWTPQLIALYVLQRTCGAFYYYFYKRTALMLGDPRFYQDSPWLREQVAKRGS